MGLIMQNGTDRQVLRFEEVTRAQVALVGGKNASLGELARFMKPRGINVAPGFATTAAMYWDFVDANGLRPTIDRVIAAYRQGTTTLAEAGATLRTAFLGGSFSAQALEAIRQAYSDLSQQFDSAATDVAVRSSATAEDLPDASFAGQQESFLNVRGETALFEACRSCFASLFTDRAISYRESKGYDHMKVALSVGVQKMVRADTGGAGVMFSIDTETGCDRVVLINAAWGLGENVVQGSVEPDEYEVFKPLLGPGNCAPIIEKRCGTKLQKLIYAAAAGALTCNVPTSAAERDALVLDDAEILQLSRWACVIEQHYGVPMDMEWARDGLGGDLYIVQARPETVQSRRKASTLQTYTVGKKGRLLLTGSSIGNAAVAGRVCVLSSARDIARFVDGSILVTMTTDPDWVPIMKRAAAIVTDEGGRTSHAAIVSRELGLPAIVGTGKATALLQDGAEITVSCAEGQDGFIYEGRAEITTTQIDLSSIPATRTKIMLNLADPAAAMHWWQLPADGVGLARMEFVVSNHVRIHPMSLVRFDTLKDPATRLEIERLTRGYPDKSEYFVDKLSRGLARIAAAMYPKPVIVRTSDFKTNEYANLIGGREFEPVEENPMIGFRGASRYYSPRYQDGFVLECRALARLRQTLGFSNVAVMIPFCRTLEEADRVLDVMAAHGLRRGENDLRVLMMCEIPSNVILAEEFAKRFDGFSIGSNDLTQLTLGIDRDSAELAALFDESNAAVQWMIRRAISAAHDAGISAGLCGQAPSDDPAFADLLVKYGIDSISVTPDSFVDVKRQVALSESRQGAAIAQAVA